jgi:hypothetical protein
VARTRVVRPWFQSWWFISLVVVLFCFAVGALTFHSLREPKPIKSPTPTASATTG